MVRIATIGVFLAGAAAFGLWLIALFFHSASYAVKDVAMKSSVA
jgi:hypothetical protein